MFQVTITDRVGLVGDIETIIRDEVRIFNWGSCCNADYELEDTIDAAERIVQEIERRIGATNA